MTAERSTGALELASVAPSGTPQVDFGAYEMYGGAALSADGTRVAFRGSGADGVAQIYLRDRTAGTTSLVSRTNSGEPGSSDSDTPSISGDGEIVAFSSNALNFFRSVNGNDYFDNVLIHDVAELTTTSIFAGIDFEGGEVANGRYPVLSSDGRYVAYNGMRQGIDNSSASGLFLFDRVTSQHTHQADSSQGDPQSLAGNGSFAVFHRQDPVQHEVFLKQIAPTVAAAATTLPETFGRSPHSAGTGSFKWSATDLALPGRRVDFQFTRTYTSADTNVGPLGPAWTHSYAWSLAVGSSGDVVTLRRGDGSREVFTLTAGTYTAAPRVRETLARETDSTFTLLLPSQVRYRFSASGRLTEIAEPAGNAVTLTYTSDALTAITDTVGRVVTLEYDVNGQLSVLKSSGLETRYSYDLVGRLVGVTDRIGNSAGQNPEQHTTTYGYEANSQWINRVTDPDGRNVVRIVYDVLGRVVEQRDGRDGLTTWQYTANAMTVTDARGNATVQSFDGAHRLTAQSSTVGSTTYTRAFTYDAAGNSTSSTDAAGNRTDLTFDSRGNVLTVVAPQLDPQIPRATVTNVYDSKNNRTSSTDARGFETTATYDPTTNLLLATTAEVAQTSVVTTKYQYGDSANPGLVTRIIAPRGNVTGTPDNTYSVTFAYDTSGNLSQTIDADGAKTTHTYDTLGRRLTTIDPDGYASGATPSEHTWTTAYDALDRVTSAADPLGNTTLFAYDGAGNRISLTDQNGQLTTSVYDAASRLWKVRQQPDPTGQPSLVYETVVTRDANGNPSSVRRANGVVTDYGYDALDRLTAVTSHPTTSTTLTTTYVLDGRGLVTSRTAGNGEVVNSVYDAMGRLVTVSATGLSTISYAYDPGSLRTAMTDGTGTSTYSYDGLGRLTQAAQPAGTTTYGYDSDSQLTTLGYPSVGNVSYAYSAGGRLSSLTDWSSRTSSYTYTAQGQAKTVTLPSSLGGLIITYSYDRADRLTLLENTVGATTISSHAYTLDPAGNRTALVEFLEGITAPSTTDSFAMSYDGLQRLQAVSGALPEGFTLDPGSNLASRTGPAKTYSYDTSDRLTGDGTSSFSWDGADRLSGRGADTFSYDALHRLTGSTVAGTARTFAYTGDGLLASSTVGGGSAVPLLWDPLTPLARLLQIGSDRIVYGLGPLYGVKADGTTQAFARDGTKSVRAEVSGSGAVTRSFRYTAYGDLQAVSPTAAVPTFLGYNSQLRDGSGLLYLRARWHDPANGRFITRDPLLGDAASPATLNAFAYGGGNPITLSDPSGYCAIATPLCIAAVAAASPALAAFAQRVGPAAANLGARALEGGYTVYQAVDKTGRIVYTGITNDFARRAAEHATEKGISISRLSSRLDNLTKIEARAIEQLRLIETASTSTLNRINSIAYQNPFFDDLMILADDLLTAAIGPRSPLDDAIRLLE